MEKEIAVLLGKNFELKSLKTEFGIDDLVAALVPQIRVWLNGDLERLLQVCYRIDLGEDKLKYLLREASPESMAEEIARALIDRHIQKIEIRQKFSEGNL